MLLAFSWSMCIQGTYLCLCVFSVHRESREMGKIESKIRTLIEMYTDLRWRQWKYVNSTSIFQEYERWCFSLMPKKFKGHNTSSNWIDWDCKTSTGFFCYKCQLAALSDSKQATHLIYPVVKGIWSDWKWNYCSNSHHSFLKAQLGNWTQHDNENYRSIIFLNRPHPSFPFKLSGSTLISPCLE